MHLAVFEIKAHHRDVITGFPPFKTDKFQRIFADIQKIKGTSKFFGIKICTFKVSYKQKSTFSTIPCMQ